MPLSLLARHFEIERKKFLMDTFPELLAEVGFRPSLQHSLAVHAATESTAWRPDFSGTEGVEIASRSRLRPEEREKRNAGAGPVNV